jgi:DNA modification methylase
MITQLTVPANSPDSCPLKIVNRRLDELKSTPGNPRRHRQWQVKQIAKSIETFGFNVPILIDNKNHIVAGHGRVEACRKLGWTEIPTIRLDRLSPEQARAFLIADNRLTDTSDWDEALLACALKELAAVDLTFDLEAIGFSMGDIDVRIEALNGTPPIDRADQLPVLNAGVPVSRVGDVWDLGDHRLLCSDSTKSQSYGQVLTGTKAALAVTDPPYNIPIAGFASGLGKNKHKDFVMGAGEMSPEEFGAFLSSSVASISGCIEDGSLVYMFMDWRSVGILLHVVNQHGLKLKNICTWAKNQAGMGSFYRSQTEFCICCKYGEAATRNNIQLGKNGRHRTNLWSYPSIATERHRSEEGDLLALHSTVKPVAMIQDIILDSTERRDVVLDPFLGSGTTLIAAQRSGRRCVGIELDPKYVDTAIRRWERFTGEQAVLAETGGTFAQIAAKRRAS